MIQSTNPKYRIKYRECTHDKNHQGEKLNFVCLNQKCCQNSLICSICREQTHKGHSIQPLKYYLQSIKKQYQNDRSDYSKQLQGIDQSRSIFLLKLRQAVQKIAEQFQKLEQQIIQRFQLLRNQIIQNQSKKNKFVDFYNSLTSQTQDNPEFLIQNYLPSKQIENLDNFEPIEQLGKKLSSSIFEARESILSYQKKQQKVSSSATKFEQKLAKTVTRTGNIYSQTNTTLGPNIENLSAVTVDLVKNFQTHRIRIKVTKLKKNSYIYVGAIQKQLFKSLNNKSPAVWNAANMVGKIYYFNNLAQTFGHTSSSLKTFSQNSHIQIIINNNIMKIAMKKNSADFTLPNNQFYFFFSLQGQAEIQMSYIKK